MMIDWAERTVCILLSLAILANALLVRRMVQAWVLPAVIFSLAWFVYTIVPLVCFPSAHVYPAAMLYIFCASIAVSIGSLSNWRQAFAVSAAVKQDYRNYYGTKLLLIVFFSSFVLTVVCLIMNSISQGISVDRLVTNINDSAAEYAGRRYTYDIAPNAYQQMSNILAYFCAGLGGLIISRQSSFSLKFLVLISSIFPAIFVMLSQSARGMLFMCAAIFYGGIIVSLIQQDKSYLLSKRMIPTLIIGLIIVIPLVTISFVARGVSTAAGQSFLDTIAPYWASYTSGHLFAFSDWFGSYIGQPSTQPYDDPGMTGGFYTFMSIFRIFGDDRPIPIGTYGEYLSIPPYIGTNIYTAFRGAVQDFGIIGSLVVIMFLSYIAHLSFRVLLRSPRPAFSVAAMLFTVAFIYQSFAISAFMWTTLIVGLIFIGITLYLSAAANRAHDGGSLPHSPRQPLGSDT